MYEFIGTSPGFDVLTYIGGDAYHAEPVVGWAIAECDGSARAFPITSDRSWVLNDNHTIMAPDGSVRCGELAHWGNIAEWLQTMNNRGEAQKRTPLTLVKGD